jgi:hypothetical protein
MLPIFLCLSRIMIGLQVKPDKYQGQKLSIWIAVFFKTLQKLILHDLEKEGMEAYKSRGCYIFPIPSLNIMCNSMVSFNLPPILSLK